MGGALTRYSWWWWQRVTSFQWDGQRDDKPVADLCSRSCGISNDGRHRPSSCPVFHHHTKFPAAAASRQSQIFLLLSYRDKKMSLTVKYDFMQYLYLLSFTFPHRKIIFLLRLVCVLLIEHALHGCLAFFFFLILPHSACLLLLLLPPPFFHPFQFALQHISPSDVVCVCVLALTRDSALLCYWSESGGKSKERGGEIYT